MESFYFFEINIPSTASQKDTSPWCPVLL